MPAVLFGGCKRATPKLNILLLKLLRNFNGKSFMLKEAGAKLLFAAEERFRF